MLKSKDAFSLHLCYWRVNYSYKDAFHMNLYSCS